jgi:hypothetical protein
MINILMASKDNTDPSFIGPGVWYLMHKDAYEAQTQGKQMECIKNIKKECDEFPCPRCRQHCQNYIKDHPIEEYQGILVENKPLGIFLWTWKFHNAVNSRLKKPIIDWRTACSLYGSSANNLCSQKCMSAGVNKKNFTLLKDLK